MIPTDSHIGLTVSLTMTINTSQGQTLAQVGKLFTRLIISHSQLYVAISRVKTKDGLKILNFYDNGQLSTYVQNVVYKEVLHKIYN